MLDTVLISRVNFGSTSISIFSFFFFFLIIPSFVDPFSLPKLVQTEPSEIKRDRNETPTV